MYCLTVHMQCLWVRQLKNLLDLWLSVMKLSRFCKRDATKRKTEHMPNMKTMGYALTFKRKGINQIRGKSDHQKKAIMVYKQDMTLTLYSTMHTNMLRGMRKKFMMVLLASSGIYWDLIFMIDGQKIPTQASNVQKPISWMQPEKEMPPPFSPEGTTKNCSKTTVKLCPLSAFFAH